MTGPQHRENGESAGFAYALCAHAIWGVMPLYLILVHTVPPVEFVAWRIIFTLPVCLAAITLLNGSKQKGGWGEITTALSTPRSLLALLASAAMIGVNWVLYVIAIQTDHVYAASLGYYILPLIMMLLGLFVLKERLNRLQWWAVTFAGIGVGLLAAGALSTLLLSLTMAATFAIYGLIRKMLNVGSLAGLTIETLLLYVPAIGIVSWYALQPAGSAMKQGADIGAAIMLGGPMTAIPLMLFATASRRMNYTTTGFIQFVSPTIVFLLGLFWFGEELRPTQLACFVLIWAAMGLFLWDLLSRNKRSSV